MSIKRLPPESIETFSMILHPKRRYSARASYLAPNTEVDTGVPANAILTEAGEPLMTEAGEYLITES